MQDVETVTVLYEGANEPEMFWSAMGGKKTYDTHADWMDGIRLFRLALRGV